LLRLLKQAINNITGEFDEIIGLDYDDEIDHSEISIINCSLPQVDNEISAITDDLDNIQISKDKDYMNIENLLISDDVGDDNDDDEYESLPLTGNQLILKLDEADGVSLNRFSCACHKANIAVRKAIKSCKVMSNDLAKIRGYTASVRKSSNMTESFKIEKCRLRCENDTRWSSAFLTLCSVYKAYKRNEEGKLI
jgi:hypothetical protein